ncbi:hypothetical protein V8C42DRAFT_331920 [Trichoderma barbatum]
MQFAMRRERTAIGHHLSSECSVILVAHSLLLAPCCSPHSSLPDAGSEAAIRLLASAVARDAVPDTGRLRLSTVSSSPYRPLVRRSYRKY